MKVGQLFYIPDSFVVKKIELENDPYEKDPLPSLLTPCIVTSYVVSTFNSLIVVLTKDEESLSTSVMYVQVKSKLSVNT